jgi:hypothetical protein
MSCTQQEKNTTMEQYLTEQQQLEDQIDYQFIQRIIQELTQSCALSLPIPASAIPPLILQAAQFFWENDDRSVEERWYLVPNSEFTKCGANLTVKLPSQIVSVFGVYKTTDSFNYGVLGDFSLERIILNNSAMTSGMGGTSMTNVFGSPQGWTLTDVTASLYELATFKAMFDAPLSFNYNAYSNDLIILGALGSSNLILQVFTRCKIQDLYKNYYFFRWCVCLGLKSMARIMGTFEFKMPGGVTINYSTFKDDAQQEMDQIVEYLNKQHSSDYFFTSNTV